MHELIELEEQGWRALSTEGDAGKKFYASVLREDAVMLFPGGMRIVGRERVVQSLGAQPWNSFRIENVQVVSLSTNAATLVYTVTAQRKGSEPVRRANKQYVCTRRNLAVGGSSADAGMKVPPNNALQATCETHACEQ
jgi:hypothetical protein